MYSIKLDNSSQQLNFSKCNLYCIYTLPIENELIIIETFSQVLIKKTAVEGSMLRVKKKLNQHEKKLLHLPLKGTMCGCEAAGRLLA